MGMRFRKSFTIAPGLRMNLSGSGLSWSVGPRGASLSFGQRGTYLNTGIPGTGLYSRERIDGSQAARSTARNTVSASVTVRVDENTGVVSFYDENGNPAPDSWVSAAKKQKGDFIRDLIQTECDKINGQVEALGELHRFTPDPRMRPQYNHMKFDVPRPSIPILKKVGFWASLFKSKREGIERENKEVLDKHFKAVDVWEKERIQFEQAQLQRKKFIEQDIYSDTSSMMGYLEECLQDISWPRETQIAFDVFDGGKRVFLDVDLPEIEDMPTKIASVPARGYKLSIKELGATQRQKIYMRHIHGVGFRIIGEVFSSLPVVEEVVLSSYSQRPDSATGQTVDDYLYSVRITRADWQAINFNALEDIDVVEAFNRFDLRRDMSKTGVFKAIKPMLTCSPPAVPM